MRPRGLVSGIVFLLLAALLLIGSSLADSRRFRCEAKNEPSLFAGGAAWAAGFVLAATESVKFTRRPLAQ